LLGSLRVKGTPPSRDCSQILALFDYLLSIYSEEANSV
jgi:hypothetical protein